MDFVAKIDHRQLPPEIQQAYFAFIQSMWKHGTVDPQIKELMRMRSATLADCKQ